ncbi:LmbU family transcriptional regulator [Streptomyces sp. P1-3]|uniref:LmbU family transcriptional regulator n=1 Tax=Streptomyces sp. P1-3 TaxID=3421658 RepID=UPI003D363436
MTSSELQLPLEAFGAKKMSPLSRLAVHGSLRKMGITFPQGMTRQSWEAIGNQLKDVSISSVWWLADWMIYGESSYGSQYREAIERTGLDYKTLRNYAWVARRFEHHRRREALSFAHHAEVARLPTPEQDYWLRKAEQQAWSRNELRKQVRASIAERESIPVPPPNAANRQSTDQQPVPADEIAPANRGTTIEIDLPVNEFDQITRIAESFGLSRNDWAARVLQSVVRTLAETKAGADAPAPAP